MKKYIASLLLAFSMLCNAIIPVSANQSVDLYAYTTSTEGFDEYAQEYVGSYMYAHYGYVDVNLKLGKGIAIISEADFQTVIYPIWNGNNIVDTFKVVNINGVYSGTYSDGNAGQLNVLKDFTSNINPMRVVVNDGELYITIGTRIFDGEIGNCIEIENITLDIVIPSSEFVINAKEELVFEQPIVSRAPAIYGLPWTYDEEADPEYLLYSEVKNYIYNYDSYIMAGMTHSSGNAQHFIVITGYSELEAGNLYTIYDPQHGGSGMVTMSASTRTYTNSDSNTFIWNAGYITNIN